MKKVNGASSWRISTRDVEAFVTKTGGHLGPATFERRGRKIRPFAVAPWCEEREAAALPPILKILRGDFFCLPFGGNATAFRGEHHPVHGETANSVWRLESLDASELHVSLNPRIRPGRVDKKITLREGHPALYVRHVISGMRGPMNPGHHAMLKFPDEPGSGIVSTSRFVQGQVYPKEAEQAAKGGYQSLQVGARFDSLERVPQIAGGFADLSRFPARRGYEDIVLVVSDPDLTFAWTAVTFPKQRYVWFALKDPRVLRETVFWISNGGRHYAPWNGRHVNVMGLEEVTSHFHEGLAESARKNPLSEKGIPTCLHLDPRRPTVINYIMAVAEIPSGFNRVASLIASDEGREVTLRSASGQRVKVPLDTGFLSGTRL
jgi:hypothetical protein